MVARRVRVQSRAKHAYRDSPRGRDRRSSPRPPRVVLQATVGLMAVVRQHTPPLGLQGPRLLSSSGRVPTAHPWRVSQDLLAYLHKQGLHTRKGSPGLRDERCGFHQTRGLTSTFISAA